MSKTKSNVLGNSLWGQTLISMLKPVLRDRLV